MTANSIGSVSLAGIFFEDAFFPVNLSGSPVAGTDEGKAVTWDTSAANTMKLAGDGDVVVGRLETIEARIAEGVTVGTVAMQFSDVLPQKASETFSVGDTAVGGGSGTVKVLKAGSPSVSAPDYRYNTVVQVNGTASVVVVKI